MARTLEWHIPAATCRMKWPNDVVVGGRKICGILMESSVVTGARTAGFVILGAGVNVNRDGFERSYPTAATSVLLESGQPVPPGEVLRGFLTRFEAEYDQLHNDRGAALRHECTARLVGYGSEVEVHNVLSGTVTRGVSKGISETGALLLRTRDGRLKAIHSGDVTMRPGSAADAGKIAERE
jgi:BirA family biotin operon repressor/biotin-[acetyl-CoA-carboxylase] ligase